MAVQAQYPSNLLLTRNGQEVHDFSSQSHQNFGEFLDHQSQMLFNHGGNFLKPAAVINTAPMNPLISLQPQQSPYLIGQIHNQQPNVVSTGLRLSFGDQQQQNQSHSQNLVSHRSVLSSLLSEDFATQIKQQRDEIDQFLHIQEEQLRRTLTEKRQRHYRALLGTAEELLSRRLTEKAAELEKLHRRTAELEARAAELTVEAQVWQAKARAQEAIAATLQAQLQQAIMRGGADSAQDRNNNLGCALGVENQAEDAESGYNDSDRVPISRPSCKVCQNRVASVVVLPCRHLCICTECERVVSVCPICLSVTNSSVEVFFS